MGIWKQTFSPSATLIVGELLKMLFAFIMEVFTNKEFQLRKRVVEIARYSLPMLIPAFVYWIMNLISFISISRIDAGTSTTLQQGKILTTAIFSVIFLSKHLSPGKWICLLGLFSGVSIISYTVTQVTSDDSFSGMNSTHDVIIGIAFKILEISLSGLMAVYNEAVLKNKVGSRKRTVWEVNIQLAFFSLIFYYPPFAYNGYFKDWTPSATALSFLHALGGIAVACAVKYSNAIKKCLAASGAIVLTSIASAMFQNGPMNLPIVTGSVLVISAVFGYNKPTVVESYCTPITAVCRKSPIKEEEEDLELGAPLKPTS